MRRTPQRKQKPEGEDKSVKKKSPAQVMSGIFTLGRSSTSKSKESLERSPSDKSPSEIKKHLFEGSGDSETYDLETRERLDRQRATTSRSEDAMNEYADSHKFGKVTEFLSRLKPSKDIKHSQSYRTTPFAKFISPRRTPMKNSVSKRIKKEFEKARQEREFFEPLSTDTLNAPTFKEIQKDYGKFKQCDLGVSESIFPSAAFSAQEEKEKERLLNRELKVSEDFINKLISSPEKREAAAAIDIYAVNPRIFKCMTKPVSYETKESYILSKASLTMKKIEIENHRRLWGFLISTGYLFFSESDNITDDPLVSYHLKNLKYEKTKENPRSMDITVRDQIKFLKLNLLFDDEITRNDWARMLHIMQDVLRKVFTDSAIDAPEREEFKNFCDYYQMRRPPYTLQSFELLKVIGRGTFGKIFTCRHKETLHPYMVKVMRKDMILDYGGVDSVIFQNYILRAYNHPFLQKLKYSMINDDAVIFIMELLTGGTLDDHVFKMKRFSQEIAVFYGIQMATAIMYLHTKAVIFRDLNLSNCCLDGKGNLKLTDFGLCVGDADKKIYNQHIEGNSYYIAPELLRGETYAFSSDWWSFGVCFYAMLTGEQIFYDTTSNEIKEVNRNEKVDFLVHSPFVTDFLKNILQVHAFRRLGCRDNEEERSILQHDVFMELLWNKFKGFEIRPPIIPDIADKYDYPLSDDVYLKQDIKLTPPPNNRREYTIVKNGILQDAFEDFLPYETSSTSTTLTKSDRSSYGSYQSDF